MGRKHYIQISGILTGVPPGTTLPAGKYIYQRTTHMLANDPTDPSGRGQIRAWRKGANPRTTPQQRNRARLALGVTAWHALSTQDKQEWEQVGAPRRISGFNAFISNWQMTQPLPLHTVWDGGATTWDGGATVWD